MASVSAGRGMIVGDERHRRRPAGVGASERGLAWFTVAWNAVEGVTGIVAGLAAGSIALVGFGVDSDVEVFAGAVILRRLSKERHGEKVSAAASVERCG